MSTKIMKWLATALFLTAGTLLSLNIEISRFGFLLFLSGHVLLSYYFYKQKDWAMTTQNGFFLFIDGLGIYRWFF